MMNANMARYRKTVLKNGMQIISSETPESPITTVSVWIKSGSRHETEHERGYAHVLEHMLLKGTKSRPDVLALNVEIDRLGAFSNAFTNREANWFVIQAAREYDERIIALIADIIKNPELSPTVLENEKRVIAEEIHRNEQNNGRFIALRAADLFFANHPLANNPLGAITSIDAATDATIRHYYERLYLPARTALISVGGVAHDRLVDLAEKYFSSWTPSTDFNSDEIQKRIKLVAAKGFHAFERTTKQVHLVFNFQTAGADQPKTAAALWLIENYLGYGRSSALIKALRHQRGLVYDLFAHNTVYSDAGRFTITTATTKPREVIRATFETLKAIASTFDKKLFSEIVEQTVAAFIRTNTNPITEMRTLGEGFLLSDRLITPAEYIDFLRNLTYQDVLAHAQQYLTPQNCFLATLGPNDPTAQEEFKIFLNA